MDLQLPEATAPCQTPARLLRGEGPPPRARLGPRRALPARGGPRAGRARLPGHARLRGVRRRGPRQPGGGGGGGGDRAGGRLAGPHRRLAQRPGHQPHAHLRQRGPAGALPAQAGHRRVAGRLGAHRAGKRLGRRGDEDHRGARRRRWVLNGTKIFITQGTRRRRLRGARLDRRLAASRRASPPSSSRRGCRASASAPIHGKLGMRSSDTAELVLEDVERPGQPAAGRGRARASSTR